MGFVPCLHSVLAPIGVGLSRYAPALDPVAYLTGKRSLLMQTLGGHRKQSIDTPEIIQLKLAFSLFAFFEFFPVQKFSGDAQNF